MKSSKLLVVIVVLQGLLLIGQWTGGRSSLPLAYAAGDVPDPAGRQMAMIEELKNVNAKLDKVVNLLEAGDLQVKVAPTDEGKGASRAR